MKHFYAIVLIALVTNYQLDVYSQKITVGIYSGVNISDIHGQTANGKWSYKPGPVQGINLGYSFNKYLGAETGLSFSANYYEYKSYNSLRDYYWYLSSSIAPEYYSTTSKMDFSFLRFPVLLKFTIPSLLQLDIKAGFYYSYLLDYTLNSSYYTPDPAENDFGYIFSSGITYPINEKFKASFSVNYLTGKTAIFEESDYRHGSSEFILGVAYNGFLNNKNSHLNNKSAADTASSVIFITLNGGVNISWNSSSTYKGRYSFIAGPSVGFSLNYKIGNKTSVQSGLSFERKGYSFTDSSTLYYRYLQNENMMYYVDTRVETDYLVIPALLNFYVGKSDFLFFNTGAWLGLKLNARCVGEAYNESHSEYDYRYVKTFVYDDIEGLIKNTDFGWQFGGGVSMPLKNRFKVDIALQYSMGFGDVFDESGFVSKYDKKTAGTVIKNGTVGFHVGVKIPPSRH